MNSENLTNKLREALSDALNIATERGHNEIKPPHLLLALLDQGDGLTEPLLQKTEADTTALRSQVEAEIDKIPRVTGSNTNPTISRALNEIFIAAEKEKKVLKDEFVSTEHILLAIADSKSSSGEIFRSEGVEIGRAHV